MTVRTANVLTRCDRRMLRYKAGVSLEDGLRCEKIAGEKLSGNIDSSVETKKAAMVWPCQEKGPGRAIW